MMYGHMRPGHLPREIREAFRRGDSICIGDIGNYTALLAEISDEGDWDGTRVDRERFIYIDHALREGSYPLHHWHVLPAVALAVALGIPID